MYSIRVTEEPSMEPPEVYRRALPIPESRLEALILGRSSILPRQDSTSTSSSGSQFTCGPNDTTGACERSTARSTNTTMPIVLGVVIPLTIAFTILIILHRRHVKKLRKEDAEDKHKSLDFGMDGAQYSEKKGARKGRSPAPEMSVDAAKGAVRQDRGVSMDMGVSNPYLLPPELHQSRESLHSLSRSMNTGDDKYRATTFIPDDGSIRSPSSLRSHWDDSSTYTGSSRRPFESESTKQLVKSGETVPQIKEPMPVAKDNKNLLAPGISDATRASYLSTNSSTGNLAAMRASNNYLGAYISGGQQKIESSTDEPSVSVAELDATPQIQEPPAAALKDDPNQRKSIIPDPDAGFNFGVSSDIPKLPVRSEARELPREQPLPSGANAPDANSSVPEVQGASRRQSSIYDENIKSFANHPNAYAWPAERQELESSKDRRNSTRQQQQSQRQQQLPRPEQSIPNIKVDEEQDDYYEEPEEGDYDLNAYRDALGYDPRLLTMGMRPLPPDDPAENPEERALRIRSFYKEYFDEAAKPGGGNRMSYFDGSENFIDDYYGTAQSSPYGSRGPSMARPATQQQRHRAMSNGSYGPRAFSSASGRYGRSGRPPFKNMPKKKQPPPKALNVLPTPFKLKDDSMLPNPMDYAPPRMFKNQRAGTPDSLKGGLRPYSPSTQAYNPLVSSFDDLAALPSPHHLRKSGTFTSLDFAPPRFATAGNASDAGSIRSNRSGVSAMHQHNIRTGAYRVSRIPKEVAGTKDEIATALRPQWNMNR